MKDANSLNPLGPLSQGALRHHVVQRLVKAIIQGELAPGTRLIANKLAVRLGVSATPIREALVELEQTGIVELLHNRGALVKPFGRHELRDFFAVRRLLECEAIRLACGHVAYERLSLLRSDLERLIGESNGNQEKWIEELLVVDRRIHLLPVEHCRNSRLIAEIVRYHNLSDAMRDIAGYSRQRHRESVAPLVDFLDAMQRHEAEAGTAAMERHICVVAAMVEAAMFDEKKDQSGLAAQGPP